MSKKKVPLSRSDDLTSVDAELEAAVDRLVGANERIGELLTELDQETGTGATPSNETAQDASSSDEAPVEQNGGS